jgi:signal transduction histidine kinase
MTSGSRLPMFVVAAALLGLIALLATLQYRWLGRVSDAERERMTASLGAHSNAFAQEFDKELTRAYATFQLEPISEGEAVATRVGARYDRWLATARYPRLIKEIYFAPFAEGGERPLQRFSPTTRFVEPVEWPAALSPLREQLAKQDEPPVMPGANTFIIRTMPSSVLEDVPALVVPTPVLFLGERIAGPGAGVVQRNMRLAPEMSLVILVLDREYMRDEMLPAMVQQHFHAAGSEANYQVAVVSVGKKDVVYRSTEAFSPDPAAKADAAADLFQVRLQEFGAIAAEVRRFNTLLSAERPPGVIPRDPIHPRTLTVEEIGKLTHREGTSVSIVLPPGVTASERTAITTGAAAAASRTMTGGPRWKLIVKHPAGSLEAAVNSARRRNLAISSSVLALLGISVGFLVMTTRRAQDLARQQMEFVAAVSHELRTPLAVIRSAGENLADGVVHSEQQVRKYGDLVRNEGRRLTEMVEQILEFAGIQSGQRGFVLRPVPLAPLVHDVVDASSTLVEGAGLRVEYEIPDSLPPVLGDEPALRRVLQNLVGNAIKYGASGGWIGIRAQSTGREVQVTVADRGIGIGAAEQGHIFEPFYRAPEVIAAQIQGAGLGLSLVKRIVDAHGGRIVVRSSPGQGSEFTVHLPAASEEPVARTATVQPPHGAAASSRG